MHEYMRNTYNFQEGSFASKVRTVLTYVSQDSRLLLSYCNYVICLVSSLTAHFAMNLFHAMKKIIFASASIFLISEHSS